MFDLGGGTFDISIMSVENGIFEVLATGGDSALGGEDWDRRMLERIVDEVFDQHRVDLTGDPDGAVAAARGVRGREEGAVGGERDRRSSCRSSPTISTARRSTSSARSRATRSSSSPRTCSIGVEAPCQRALDRRRARRAADIEEVLLVGGMTRWPAVQAHRRAHLRQASRRKGANPDEVVALGAAAYAGILAGEADDAALLDVTPHDIGIKVGDSRLLGDHPAQLDAAGARAQAVRDDVPRIRSSSRSSSTRASRATCAATASSARSCSTICRPDLPARCASSS